jgi:hypothetical protein
VDAAIFSGRSLLIGIINSNFLNPLVQHTPSAKGTRLVNSPYCFGSALSQANPSERQHEISFLPMKFPVGHYTGDAIGNKSIKKNRVTTAVVPCITPKNQMKTIYIYLKNESSLEYDCEF